MRRAKATTSAFISQSPVRTGLLSHNTICPYYPENRPPHSGQ
jgi:hypothetical protein